MSDQLDEECIQLKAQELQNEKIRIENKNRLWKYGIKLTSYICGSALSLYFIIFLASLWITTCEESNKIYENNKQDYYSAFEECTLKLGIQICDSVQQCSCTEQIKESTYAAEQCIKALGITKCVILKNYNRHDHDYLKLLTVP